MHIQELFILNRVTIIFSVTFAVSSFDLLKSVGGLGDLTFMLFCSTLLWSADCCDFGCLAL